MNLTYAPAKEEDLSLLFSLNKNLIDTYEDTTAIAYDPVLTWVRQNLAISLPNFRRVYADGLLAAFYCLTKQENTWELDSLFVLPDFQRKGIGTKILEQCIAETGGNVFFYVFRNNTGAVSLYSRMGFRITRSVGQTRYIMTYEKAPSHKAT